jgi:uncharacterized protein (TIGR02145 family)
MCRILAILFFLFFSNCAVAQSLGGYPIYDYLMTAVHPTGCNPAYVTGMPDDSLWVNFGDNDIMTGTFRLHWVDRPADDLLLETGYNTSNYQVRLLLTTGFYSASHHVAVGDWTQITDTLWHYVPMSCTPGSSTSKRIILPLDFQTHFGLTTADTVTGIEVVFLTCVGAPDLAGAYIIQEPLPCDTVQLGPDTSLCYGENLLLNATKLNSTYLWQDNSTNPTYNVTFPGTFWVKVTEPNCTTSDTIIISIAPGPTVTNNPLSKAICTGESTNIFLTSNVPGTNFHWAASLTNGNITGFSADSGLVINHILVNHLPTAGIVTYHITPKVGSCIGSAVDFAVTINPGDSAKVSIIASINTICAGTSVTFTATPTNPGTTPVYQWKVNGVISGTSNPTFSYTPLNGDQVKCVLTSSITVCISNNPATSNTITMIVNPNLPVSVSVSPSANPVCAGTLVTFTATPTNGGTNPSFQWKVNGAIVGTNSPTFSYFPLNNDIVICTLTSSELCTTNNPASSIQYPVSVYLGLPSGVSITAAPNPFCPGTSVTFTATPNNGGTNPSYQWKVNATNAGTNSFSFTYNPVTGDKVTCVMTSNLACVSGNPALSNEIDMDGSLAPYVSFIACFDTITTSNAKPIKLKGGIPLGGAYSGTGVSVGYYNPNIAGIGTHMITYTYTNSALCSAAKSSPIHQFTSSPFTCGNNLTDIRDGKIYPTVKIGSQCWFAANLNYGNPVSSIQHQRDNCIPEKYLQPPPGLPLHGEGSVYQWDEMMQYDDTPAKQGLCPPGWHIPTEAEWITLFANWTNSGFAGSPLKYSGYSGFNALLSGVNHLNRQWDFNDFATFFWSSTAHGSIKAWAHGMNDYNPSVSVYPSSRANAFSVRCLKDN